MRKWLSLLILGVLFVFPSLASAQGPIRLATLDVKFWPEYDNSGMLVIYDFELPKDAPLPTSVTFRIPLGVSVHAVAALEDAGLFQATFLGPTPAGDWQTLTIPIDKQTSYHFEYYAPLNKSGDKRQFTYIWAGDYAVDKLGISVQQPPDATSLTGNPALESFVDTDGLTYHTTEVTDLKAGEQFTFTLEYNKTTETLTAPSTTVEPSAPLGEDTTGRVSLGIYTPYIIGGLGILLIASGVGYYYLWARRGTPKQSRRRLRSRTTEESVAGADVYCPQCGQRGRSGDRFCRVCGTRFRQES